MSGKWSGIERGSSRRSSSGESVSHIGASACNQITDCATVELVGYGARAASARQTPNWSLMPYIMQSLLLLLGPSFFAASIYMILGRIIRLTGGERHSLIRPSWLTKIFVVGDVLSFFVQSGGKLDLNIRQVGPHVLTCNLHRWRDARQIKFPRPNQTRQQHRACRSIPTSRLLRLLHRRYSDLAQANACRANQ